MFLLIFCICLAWFGPKRSQEKFLADLENRGYAFVDGAKIGLPDWMPDEVLEHVNYEKIQWIYLSGRFDENDEPLPLQLTEQDMRRLASFDLYGIEIGYHTELPSCGIAPLARCQNLVTIYLSSRLSDDMVDAMPNMPQVTLLHLDDDADISPTGLQRLLEKLPGLEELLLENGRYFPDLEVDDYEILVLNSAIWKQIGRLTNLRRLEVDCDIESQDDFKYLSSHRHLTELAVKNHAFDQSGIDRLKDIVSLETLNIEIHSVSGKPGLLSLKELPNLKRLDVRVRGGTWSNDYKTFLQSILEFKAAKPDCMVEHASFLSIIHILHRLPRYAGRK